MWNDPDRQRQPTCPLPLHAPSSAAVVSLWDSCREVTTQKNRDQAVHLYYKYPPVSVVEEEKKNKKQQQTTAAYCEDHAKQFLSTVMQVVHTAPTMPQRVLP
jgi:hypothetical protein